MACGSRERSSADALFCAMELWRALLDCTRPVDLRRLVFQWRLATPCAPWIRFGIRFLYHGFLLAWRAGHPLRATVAARIAPVAGSLSGILHRILGVVHRRARPHGPDQGHRV